VGKRVHNEESLAEERGVLELQRKERFRHLPPGKKEERMIETDGEGVDYRSKEEY